MKTTSLKQFADEPTLTEAQIKEVINYIIDLKDKSPYNLDKAERMSTKEAFHHAESGRLWAYSLIIFILKSKLLNDCSSNTDPYPLDIETT